MEMHAPPWGTWLRTYLMNKNKKAVSHSQHHWDSNPRHLTYEYRCATTDHYDDLISEQIPTFWWVGIGRPSSIVLLKCNCTAWDSNWWPYHCLIFDRTLQHGLRPARQLRVWPLRLPGGLARRPLQHQGLRRQVHCTRILLQRNLLVHQR